MTLVKMIVKMSVVLGHLKVKWFVMVSEQSLCNAYQCKTECQQNFLAKHKHENNC